MVLLKSEFVNLKIRRLSAETCHEFIEWCGLLKGMTEHESLRLNKRSYKQDLYIDFMKTIQTLPQKLK